MKQIIKTTYMFGAFLTGFIISSSITKYNKTLDIKKRFSKK